MGLPGEETGHGPDWAVSSGSAWEWAERDEREGWADFGLRVLGFLSFSSLFLIQTKFEFKYKFEFKPHSIKSMHQHECINKI